MCPRRLIPTCPLLVYQEGFILRRGTWFLTSFVIALVMATYSIFNELPAKETLGSHLFSHNFLIEVLAFVDIVYRGRKTGWHAWIFPTKLDQIGISRWPSVHVIFVKVGWCSIHIDQEALTLRDVIRDRCQVVVESYVQAVRVTLIRFRHLEGLVVCV